MMIDTGLVLESPPAQLLICYLHYKTLKNSRINGYCLLYCLLMAIPIIKNTSFACVGQYSMILLRCFDIQLMDPSITRNWSLRTYIRVFWATQTVSDRNRDLKLVSLLPDSAAKMVIESHVDLAKTDSSYWLILLFNTTWQLVAFITIPAYFYRNYLNWDPETFELLDFSNPTLIMNYSLHLLLVYCAIVLSRSISGHTVSLIFSIPYREPMIQPWSSTSLSQFWGFRWNGTVQGCLKRIGYDPIKLQMRGLHGYLLASLAAFCISALLHEYTLIAFTGTTSLEQLSFFLIQFLFLITEGLMLKTVKRLTDVDITKDLPWLGWFYTMAILFWTSPLMLNPYIRKHVFYGTIPFGYLSSKVANYTI